jgi:S-adenosylmethionine-diacylglycerol 3-amino-3-carboxypropyl transferase
MTDLSADIALSGRRHIKEAVYQHGALSAAGLSERLFALLFSGLVYPQIWEDPEVDIEAMALGEGHRVVTIASGGCNVLSYLTRAPGRIDAVDLNRAHVALNRLKLEALRRLPSQGDFFRFFGATGFRHNTEAYDRFVAPHLDREARRYWEGRDLAGRRRIAVFDRDFYRTGLLGLCIAMGHAVARLHGVNPAEIMEAKDLRAQRIFFAEQLGPLFERRFVRWATSKKASLFGLGIPPAQYEALAGGETMADVLSERVRKLACDFPLKANYFAWQAFARRYPQPGEAALPPYLEARHFETLRAHADRVTVHQANFTDLLARKPAASVDRYVLLDAQDWMSDAQLDALWTEITRTAAPGARVIFRTAAMPTLLPGRVSAGTLAQWHYDAEASADYTARDRSAIYGGFHLYVKRG